MKKILWFIQWMKFELEWLLEELDDRFQHSNWALSILTETEETRRDRETLSRLTAVVRQPIGLTPDPFHIGYGWAVGSIWKTARHRKQKQS
jgi:hypothetical protein